MFGIAVDALPSPDVCADALPSVAGETVNVPAANRARPLENSILKITHAVKSLAIVATLFAKLNSEVLMAYRAVTLAVLHPVLRGLGVPT